jgi:hypothetical protein
MAGDFSGKLVNKAASKFPIQSLLRAIKHIALHTG